MREIHLILFLSVAVSAAQEFNLTPTFHFSAEGMQSGDLLGFGLYAVDDVNGDGFIDFAATTGNRLTRSYLQVFSGSDGSVIHTISNPEPGSWFGYQNNGASLGDIDGDHVPDFIIGHRKHGESGETDYFNGTPGTGRAVVYSGKTGDAIWTHLGSGIDDTLINFGTTIDVLRDIDGDGIRDYAIGNGPWAGDQHFPRHTELVEANRYSIHLFSGKNGQRVASILSSEQSIPIHFASLDDINGDGASDLAVTIADVAAGFLPTVQIISGQFRGAKAIEEMDETVRLTHFVHHESEFSPPGIGMNTMWLWSPADFNGDGLRDLVYLFELSHAENNPNALGVGAVDPSSGNLLWQSKESVAEFFLYRQSVASPGDLDQDGTPDLILGGRHSLHPFTILSGKTGQLLYSPSRGERDALGDYVVALSDLDGDGLAEIAISDRENGPGKIHVYSFSPGPIDKEPVAVVETSLHIGVDGLSQQVDITWSSPDAQPHLEASKDLKTWTLVPHTQLKSGGRLILTERLRPRAQYYRLRLK